MDVDNFFVEAGDLQKCSYRWQIENHLSGYISHIYAYLYVLVAD